MSYFVVALEAFDARFNSIIMAITMWIDTCIKLNVIYHLGNILSKYDMLENETLGGYRRYFLGMQNSVTSGCPACSSSCQHVPDIGSHAP